MCGFFSYVTGLQSKIRYFNKNTATKVFPVSFVRKQSKWRHFIKVAGLLSRFYKPLKGTRHKKFPEERLWWREFTVQFTIYNHTVNWLHQKYFLWVFRFYKIARRASLAESLFSKVIGEISTLYKSIKNSITCTGVFQKVVLLEISRNLQFATLTPNNFLKCLDWSLQCSSFLVNCMPETADFSLAHFWNSEKFLR